MGCPTTCILGENLTFSTQARDGTGAPVSPTGNVNYVVYEDTTTTEIITSTAMTKDFDSKTGFCVAQIACTAANGFERYKTYTIRITATVAGVSVAKSYSTLCLGVEDTPSATTGALTTTALFKSYAGITSTDDDTLIGYLVSRATSAIENYCGRRLRSDTYRHRFDGDGDAILLLPEWPVTAVTLLSVGTQDVIRIKNTSSDAYNAYVTVVEDDNDPSISETMTLYIEGGTNDGNDALTLSSYTVTTLVTAINALGKGWTAIVNISVWGVWDAVEILPCSGLSCLDKLCYVQTPYKSETSFKVRGQKNPPYQDNYGEIYLATGFTQGNQNIILTYTAGYTTTPADLEQICIDLINTYYQSRSTDSTVKSERLGDHSITYAEGGGGGARDIPTHIAKRLAPYKRWSEIV